LTPHSRILDQFDVVIFSQQYDSPFYEGLLGNRALWLGWGSDVLGLGSAAIDRPIDVLRVGRQPAAWDDDAFSTAACASRGLTFQGRPPFYESPEAQQRALMQEHYGRAKFVLAHSNVAAPASYTHATKEYITARWTDALAAGATVAGMPPLSDKALIDWPGALLPFDRIDFAHNLDAIEAAVSQWTPSRPLRNHLNALKRLDWRWRFARLAEVLGLDPTPLRAALQHLHARIDLIEGTLRASGS
jgi:hypothetical protein